MRLRLGNTENHPNVSGMFVLEPNSSNICFPILLQKKAEQMVNIIEGMDISSQSISSGYVEVISSPRGFEGG